MAHWVRLLVALAAVMAACTAQNTTGDARFNGRWNLAVGTAGDRAWWLEVNDAGTPQLRGRFVGAPGGDMNDIPEIAITGGELVFAFQREQTRLVYHARLEGDRMVGYMVTEGGRSRREEFTGERAPAIRDRDDGSWKPGAPVELVNGKDLTGWRIRPGDSAWSVRDGILTNTPRSHDLTSERTFWNFRLHAEYRLVPHSNSGIGLRDRYEVQILDDFGAPPQSHGHGAIYSRIAPSVNASRRPGEWQTLDVTLVGRFVTVILNGWKVIDNAEIEGPTAMGQNPYEDRPGPITLQGDHEKIEIRRLTVVPLVR